MTDKKPKSTTISKRKRSGTADRRDKLKSASKAADRQQSADRFPVVGIGASAGGLETLERLFDVMPIDIGAAFVVIVHLQPNQASLMPELVQRHTAMPVNQISDRMKIAPNEIYIIPPDYHVTLADAHLDLGEREHDGPPTPIDRFFESLAEERRENAIAVVLSGAGSDGAKGARRVQDELGLVIAQDPDTARHRAMPDAVAHFADQILRPEEIAQYLNEYIRERKEKRSVKIESEDDEAAVSQLFLTLKQETGHDFSSYKRTTIYRRIVRRLNVLTVSSISEYSAYLRSHPEEVQVLFRELLIGVTAFFRDPQAYTVLKDKVLPKIVQDKGPEHTVRVWVPGVATGEEAYSIAILLEELNEKKHINLKIQIFATDIDDRAIEFARAALYPEGITNDISEHRLERSFEHEGDRYRIKRHIREKVIFAVQNVIHDPPFTRIDLISCRNLLIYLNKDMQKKLLPVFHYSLRDGGFLWLGTSESVGEYSDYFQEIDAKNKIYRARESVDGRRPLLHLPMDVTPADPSGKPVTGTRQKESGVRDAVNRILLDEYTPPCAVINQHGDIVHIVGRTGKFLEPAPGAAAMKIFDMAREGLKGHLPSLVRRAATEWKTVKREKLKVNTGGDEMLVNLIVRPVNDTEAAGELLLVIFEEVAAKVDKTKRDRLSARDSQDDRRHLEQELQHTRENLQSTVEELETANEELKSTNEEYQSTNEELRSANEELETSREELQSVNEELSTVNRELQEKIESISAAHREMQNFLNSLGVPTIFLDKDLRIKRYTVQATDIVKLIASDIGRPLSDMSYDLSDHSLAEDARRVRDTMVYQEKEVETKDGHWYLRRIIPYQSSDDTGVGVVINFVDVDEAKQKSLALAQAEARLQATRLMVETLPQPLVLLDADLNVISANLAFLNMFRIDRKELEGKPLLEVSDGYFRQESFERVLNDIFSVSSDTSKVEVDFTLPGGQTGRVMVRARRAMIGDEMQQRVLLQIGTNE